MKNPYTSKNTRTRTQYHPIHCQHNPNWIKNLKSSHKHERTASTATLDATNKRSRLLAAVEVVPLAASAAPVIVGCLGVGKVVGILGLHVVEASGLVEVRGLCVEGGL